MVIPMTRRPLCEFFVASCVDNGGIYRYRLFENGEVEQLQKISMPSPMFFAVERERLWAILREPFALTSHSGVAAYDLRSGRRLTDVISTQGEVACHLAVDGKDVYVANYTGGSVFKFPDIAVRHKGHGTDPSRQTSPHPHSVFFSPDKKYVLSCDLGIDTVFVYDRELCEISRARVPDGSGARHLTFSRDGRYVYCINEMAATVSTFAYRDGSLTYLHSVSATPDGFLGQGKGAAIKLARDGRHLYVTERGSERIVLFEMDGERLKRIAHFDTHGKEPRDFALVANEGFAICANQFSGNLSVYKKERDHTLTYLSSFSIPAPLCVEEII